MKNDQKTKNEKHQKIDYKNGNFTIVHNSILEAQKDDILISLEAIGLYVYMKSKPSNWHFNVRALSQTLKTGTKKIARVLRELEDLGLIEREQKTIEHNKFGKIDYKINDVFISDETTISRVVVSGTRETTTHKKNYIKQRNIDKLNDKGTFSSPQQNHFLTNALIDKKILSSLDWNVKKFNILFTDLDKRYNYNLVLDATRYLTDNMKKDKKYNQVDDVYAYFKTSIINNLNMLEKQGYKSNKNITGIDKKIMEEFSEEKLLKN